MRPLTVIGYWLLAIVPALAGNRIYSPQVKTLQAVVNLDWLSPAVMQLGSDDVLNISFDELSHDYHRYICHIERCEADWTTAGEVFESDWLEGFNDIVVDDCEPSINTIIPYTHYRLQIPNDLCRLKLSGNYRLHIIDDDTQQEHASVELMVTEQTMALACGITTNTDIGHNTSHQQLSMSLSYGQWSVTNPQKQIYTVVRQNNRDDNSRHNVSPTAVSTKGMEWTHHRQLIFDGGNEYRKYEVLDPSHPTMGIDHIHWDGTSYQVFPFISEPRPGYIYDEDANGSFYIRNSDNIQNDITTEYVWVNYRLLIPPSSLLPPHSSICIDGQWTTESPDSYIMTYDETTSLFTASILQKQGYYSYQYLWQDPEGNRHVLPSEGNFYQTENRYQVYIYYKGTGERTWRLVSYRDLRYSSGV